MASGTETQEGCCSSSEDEEIENPISPSSKFAKIEISPVTPKVRVSRDIGKDESEARTPDVHGRPSVHHIASHDFEDYLPDQEDENCLFVGDVGKNVTVEMLHEEFSKYGEITQIDMKRDKESGQGLGYCFVHFDSPEQATLARRKAHRTKLGSRAIRIGRARRNTALYIDDLDPSVGTDDLQKAFRPFGELVLEGTYVVRHCYGFIRFRHRRDAEAAKHAMDGAEIKSCNVTVRWGEADLIRSSVQVQYEKKASLEITNAMIKSVFSKFGNVVAVDTPSISHGGSRRNSFVHFEDTDAGYIAAVNAIKKVTHIAGVQVWCHHARKLQPVTKNLHRSRDEEHLPESVEPDDRRRSDHDELIAGKNLRTAITTNSASATTTAESTKRRPERVGVRPSTIVQEEPVRMMMADQGVNFSSFPGNMHGWHQSQSQGLEHFQPALSTPHQPVQYGEALHGLHPTAMAYYYYPHPYAPPYPQQVAYSTTTPVHYPGYPQGYLQPEPCAPCSGYVAHPQTGRGLPNYYDPSSNTTATAGQMALGNDAEP